MKKALVSTVLLLVSGMAQANDDATCKRNLFEALTEGKESSIVICELDNGMFRYQVSDNITKTGIVFVDVEKKFVSYSDEQSSDNVYNKALYLEKDEIYYGVSFGTDSNKSLYGSSTIAGDGEIKQEYRLDTSSIKHIITDKLYEEGIQHELPD